MWISKKNFMKPKNTTSKTVFEKLIQPLSGLIQQCNHKRVNRDALNRDALLKFKKSKSVNRVNRDALLKFNNSIYK